MDPPPPPPTPQPHEPLTAAARHALRGVSASLAVGALLASASVNRRALLSFRASQLAALKLVRPSRNALAIAVFVGVFRLLDRYARLAKQKPSPKPHEDKLEPPRSDDPASKPALATAAVLSLACLHPESRTPIVSLVATHAASSWFVKFIAAHPELAGFQPLELMVFMAASGWIFYSGFFQPESYAPAHLKLIKKYSLTSERVATFLQSRYKQGLNPTSCEARHAGRSCGEFARNTYLAQTVAMALRIYAPVHVTTWLLALRHRAVREKPLKSHVEQLAKRITQSAMYFITYVFIGWTSACYTNTLGSRSLTARKVQFLVCGALPAVALLFESKSRRRPIGVILSSYAFVSMGTVLSQQRGFRWLQRDGKEGFNVWRTLLEVVVAASSVAYTFGDIIEGSAVVQRMLLGHPTAKRIRRFSNAQDAPAKPE